MKLNPKYTPVLIATGMALTMGFVMSAAMTLANAGWGPGYWAKWWHSVWISDVVGVPASILLSPPIGRLVGWLTAKTPATT